MITLAALASVAVSLLPGVVGGLFLEAVGMFGTSAPIVIKGVRYGVGAIKAAKNLREQFRDDDADEPAEVANQRPPAPVPGSSRGSRPSPAVEPRNP